ncbi:MAG: hypothetical protein ABJA78_09665 [Ferruginibacter sp.]
MRVAKKIIFSIFFFYILLELGCFILLKTRFSSAHFPTFKMIRQSDSFQSHIAEISPEWGMWHYPNQVIERKINCLNFTVHTNSFGARDKERVKAGDTNRVIFLGDSYIEGWGMNENNRLSNLMESSLNKEVLNFGCGWFTPTQEYLVYKHLAKDFSHSTIVWAILPFNDFNCDDTTYHEPDNYSHYQPYFEGEYPNYHLMYREDSLLKSTFNKENYKKPPPLSGKQKFSNFLSEFTFWYNIYQNTRQKAEVDPFSNQGISGYYDYKQSELNKLLFIIKKLKDEAIGKKIIILTLPVKNDFEKYRVNKIIPLKNSLDSFSRAEGITYLDLLTTLHLKENDPDKLYFQCDGHWNEYANKLASEILFPVLKNK